MVVHPSQKYRLWREFQQFLDPFAVLQKCRQTRTILQGDLTEQTNSDDLPKESQDQVWRSFGEVVGIDVDDVATDGLS